VHVVSDKLIKSVELVNLNGAVVGRINPNSNEAVFPTSERGMLLVRIQTADKSIRTQKVIIRE
ncbi:MAG TPA: T9SS type A sorting domain-containing protein, partial [Prolixibacteraceae bacterium]|nr:T9SS type A sorting domain-containing protein [Prolixibacteraceae bacterium]